MEYKNKYNAIKTLSLIAGLVAIVILIVVVLIGISGIYNYVGEGDESKNNFSLDSMTAAVIDQYKIIFNETFYEESVSEIKQINLEEHPLYKDYEFSDDEKVIDVGIQPLLNPTPLISEVMKRDKIFEEELTKLGYSVKFYNVLKGNDANYFLEKGYLEAAISGDMPSIRIASTDKAVSVSLMQEGPMSIISRNLQEVQELRGKRIGYPLGSNAHFYLLNTLKKNNINFNEVILIQMDVTKMPEALKNKEIDAFSAWEPTPAITLKKYPQFITTHRGISHGFLYIKKEIMQKNPEVAKLFIASEIRALNWIKKNKRNKNLAASWSIEIAKEIDPNFNLSIKEIVQLATEDLLGILTMEYPRIDSEFFLDNGIIKKEFELLLELDLISSNVEWSTVRDNFDTKIIEEVIQNSEKYRIFEDGINNEN